MLYIIKLFLKLSFDRANHDTFHKVFLHKWIHTDDRQAGDNNQGVFQQICHSLFSGQNGIVHDIIRADLVSNKDVPKNYLQRVGFLSIEVDHSVKISVPVSDSIVQRNNRNNRLGKRQHHCKKEPEIGASVNLSCFQQVCRNTALHISFDMVDDEGNPTGEKTAVCGLDLSDNETISSLVGQDCGVFVVANTTHLDQAAELVRYLLKNS